MSDPTRPDPFGSGSIRVPVRVGYPIPHPSTYLFVYCFSEILGLPITTNSISNRPYYYTCQCKLGYGYENCTETSEDAGSINFGYTFCELDNDNVTIIPASESLPLIFIDHVAYGSPLENPTPDPKCQNYYATSIDKVR